MSDTEALNRLAVSPSGFVFDPMTGATYSVNDTGLVILEGLRKGDGLAEIRDALSEAFATDMADTRRDILEFVRLLCEQGLLPHTFEVA
jgi:hypothetical protein